jgi:hypothetical protein
MVSGHPIADHFVGVNKMVDLGSGSQREIEDIMLTRFACYLIAQNGDSRKPEIASLKRTSPSRPAAQNSSSSDCWRPNAFQLAEN